MPRPFKIRKKNLKKKKNQGLSGVGKKATEGLTTVSIQNPSKKGLVPGKRNSTTSKTLLGLVFNH